MTPTPELRFVEREVTTPHPKYIHVSEIKTVRVLQQKWERFEHGYALDTVVHEWRDVPLVKEDIETDPAKIRALFEGDDA